MVHYLTIYTYIYIYIYVYIYIYIHIASSHQKYSHQKTKSWNALKHITPISKANNKQK